MKIYSFLFAAIILVSHFPTMAQDVIMVESDKQDDNLVNITSVKIEGGYISLVAEHKRISWEDPKMNPRSVFNKALNYNYISDEGNVYLSKFDDDLNLVAQNKVKFKNAHDINIYGMFHHEGKTSLYYTQRKNFSDEVHLFCMDIDNDRLKRNKARKIYTIVHRDGIPATRMIVSPDNTKLAFISEKYSGNKDERKLYIALFNVQGTPIWEDPVFLGANTERLTVGDAALDNTGNVYISYKLYDRYSNERSKKNKNGDRIPTYKTRVVTYGIDETEVFVTLEDQDKFIRRCDIVYNPIKDKMQAIGTYSIKDGGNLTGVYSSDIDPIAMTASATSFHKFDKQLIDLIDEDGFGQIKDKDPGVEIRDVEINMHIKKNGDLVYVMQPYKYDERFMNNSFRTNTMRNIESGYNIYSTIVAQLTKDETIFTRIPRRSNGLSDFGELIGKSLVHNDQVYLIYTDYHKNIERDLNERPNSMRIPTRSSLILTNIDNEGNFYRSFLKNRNEEDNYELSMAAFHAISDNEFMYTFYFGGFFSSDRVVGSISFK